MKWVAVDPEGDDVSISILECASDSSIACNAEASGQGAKLNFTEAGVYTFTVKATDSNNNSTESSISIEVIPLGNQAPIIQGFEYTSLANQITRFVEPNGNLILREGEAGSISVIATDRNADVLTFNWPELSCTEQSCDITSITAQPQNNLTINSIVSDSELTTNKQLNVTVQEDTPPLGELTLDKYVVGESNETNNEAIKAFLSIQDDFTAIGSIAVEWQLTDSEGMDYISSTNYVEGSQVLLLTIQEQSLPIGTYTLTAIATDLDSNGEPGQKTSASKNFEVSEDLSPTISLSASESNLYATSQGANSDLTLVATISDDNTPVGELKLDWSIYPNLPYSQDSNEITIIAADLAVGTYIVTATVTDEVEQSTSTEYTVEVLENKAPVIHMLDVFPATQPENGNGRNSEEIVAELAYSDDFSKSLTVNWSVSPNVSFNSDSSQLIVAADSVPTGDYIITAEVIDEQGQATTRTSKFVVTEDNGNVGIIVE